MKKAILIATFVLVNLIIFAQPTPPSGGYLHGGGNTQTPGNGAPLGSGLVILIILSTIYGIWKYYQYIRTNRLENKESIT